MTLKAIVLFRCGVQVAGVEDSRMAVPVGVCPVMWRVMGGRSGESWVGLVGVVVEEEDIVVVVVGLVVGGGLGWGGGYGLFVGRLRSRRWRRVVMVWRWEDCGGGILAIDVVKTWREPRLPTLVL